MKRLLLLLITLALLAGCVAEPPATPVQETEAQPKFSGGLEKLEVWELALVNEENPLDKDFLPVLSAVQDTFEMDARVAPYMCEMLEAAKAQGIVLVIVSAYRPYDRQERNLENLTAQYKAQGYSEAEARERAGRLIAMPGMSEHQTGLAADIVTPAYMLLNEGYENTDAAKWLLENAADFGFILRYPKGKTEITGFDFEPWHYRYVGIEAARDIMTAGLCLEEYLA